MLKIENLIYAYEQQDTIKNVSMDFDKGSITGILGANGSGKSTIMKLIMGLLPAKSGQIIYDNEPLVLNKKALYKYRQSVCIVFQDSERQLFYALVKDDVALALKNLGYAQEQVAKRVDEALEDMQIVHLKERPIQYLSFGQKKRVAIAGILALKPDYILLDEPTAGLDPRGRNQMLKLMKRLADNGTKIILSSHDMDLMYDCCDYAYVLEQGDLVAEGTKQEVFLDEALLQRVGLEAPWLVKLHKRANLPLYMSEEVFFNSIGSDN